MLCTFLRVHSFGAKSQKHLIQQKCDELHRNPEGSNPSLKCPNIEGRFAQWSCVSFRKVATCNCVTTGPPRTGKNLVLEAVQRVNFIFFLANYLYHLHAWICDCLMLGKKFQNNPNTYSPKWWLVLVAIYHRWTSVKKITQPTQIQACFQVFGMGSCHAKYFQLFLRRPIGSVGLASDDR